MLYNPEDNTHRIKLARLLRAVLFKWDFERDTEVFSSEEVYRLPIGDTGMCVLVYSTIENDKVRALDSDAIRVSAVYKNKSGSYRGIASSRRVYRTGHTSDIAKRMIHRVTNVWESTHDVGRCRHCNAPKFKSSKGNMVCADFCWSKD